MTFDDLFKSARDGAMADLRAAEAGKPMEAAAPAVANPEASPVAAAPDATAVAVASEGSLDAAVAAPSTAATAVASDAPAPEGAASPAAPEGRKWTIKHNGKMVVVASEYELISLAQQGFDYTQKRMVETEAVRSVQKELDTIKEQREKEVTSMREFLNDEDLVDAYLADLRAKRAPEATPDAPVTAATAKAITDKAVEEAVAKERDRMAKEQLHREVEASRKVYASTVDETLAKLKTEFPVLAKRRNIERQLVAEVAPQVQKLIEANPDQVVPIEKVVEMLRAAAKAEADDLALLMSPAETQAAAAKANAAMSTRTGAPAGGTAAPTTPAEPVKFKIGDPRLRAAALADLKRIAAGPDA